MFCSNCGKEMAGGTNFCPSCGAKTGATPETAAPAQPAQSSVTTVQLTLPKTLPLGLIIILAGAVLMLIALTLPWYSVHFSGMDAGHFEKFNIGFGDLHDSLFREFYHLNWLGAAMPSILLIICAAGAALAALYSIFSGQSFKKLFSWLCFISVAALTANLLYLMVERLAQDFGDNDIVSWTAPHAGWVMLFIGALAIGAGNRKL